MAAGLGGEDCQAGGRRGAGSDHDADRLPQVRRPHPHRPLLPGPVLTGGLGRYVPREWMLVDAYTAANRGDYSEIKALHNLFKKPYDEQPELEVRSPLP